MISVNCSAPWLVDEWRLRLPLQINSDIAGKGVITNFIATAYIVWGLMVFNYIFSYDPLHDPFSSYDHGGRRRHTPNSVDVALLGVVRRWLRIGQRWRRTACIIDECILAMCDMQVITGLAILISGFIIASKGQLDAFHWNIITRLGFFSAVTHLSGLTVLRTYFSDRPRVKAARFALMSLFILILFIANLPTAIFDWERFAHARPMGLRSCNTPMSPALCYLNLNRAFHICEEAAKTSPYYSGVSRARIFLRIVVDNTLLVLGYATRCVKFFRPLSDGLAFNVRKPLSRLATKILQTLSLLSSRRSDATGMQPWHQIWFDIGILPLLSVFLSLRLNLELFNSMFAEICYVFMALAWTTQKIFGMLRIGDFGESPWGLGQLMSVITVASPLLLIVWRFGDEPRSASQPSQSRRTDQSPGVEMSSQPGHDAATSQPTGTANTTALLGSNSVAYLVSRDQFDSATWLKGSMFLGCGFLAGGVFILNQTANYPWQRHYHDFAPAYDLSWALFRAPGLFQYFTVGYPSACAVTILIGLHLDRWSNIRRPLKALVLWFAGATAHFLYFTNNWPVNPFFAAETLVMECFVRDKDYFFLNSRFALNPPYVKFLSHASATAFFYFVYVTGYNISKRWVAVAFCLVFLGFYMAPIVEGLLMRGFGKFSHQLNTYCVP